MTRYLLFAVVVGLLLSACTSLFFRPGKVFVENGEVRALGPEDVYFTSSDGTKLHGWLFRGQGEVKRGTILVCHGNVENISTHVKLDLWLVRAGFELFIFDYRGYGRSEGETTVAGIHRDAHAALAWLLDRPGAGGERIIVYGKSLGGAVAVHLAATTDRKDRIRGLVIEGAFADYRMMAREEVRKTFGGWLVQYPLSLLVNNVYSPRKFIARAAPIPLLLLHGAADPLVPVEHGRLLYAEASEPKQYWELPGLGHVKAWTDETTRRRLLAYLDVLPR